MFNPVITVQLIRSYVLCRHCTDEEIRAYVGDGLPLLDCLRLESASIPDRIWLFANAAPPEVARLFACDCVERSLSRACEEGYATHPRSWEAVNVGRRFAKGEATAEELATAEAAAWEAARVPTWGASRAAASAACDAPRAALGAARVSAESEGGQRWLLARAIELCEQWDQQGD